MRKPTFSVFTAQDARNIATEESGHNLGQVIDAIRRGAKQGYTSMSIAGANIEDSVLDTLKQRGFEVDDLTISWAIKEEKPTVGVVEEETEDIDNEPSAEEEE